MKKNKGITLVALVVTIIVLLILAAVSINFVLGENGIITRARQAAISTEVGSVKTVLELAQNEYKIEKEKGTDKTNEDYLVEKGFLDGNTGEVLIDNIIDNPNTGKGTLEVKKDVYVYSGGIFYYYDKNGNEEVLIGIDTDGSVMGIRFEKLYSTGNFAIAIDTNGDLWGWGYTSLPLIPGATETKVLKAQRINIGVKVKDVRTTNTSVAVIDVNGNIWTWGKNDHGSLGRGEVDAILDKPEQITNDIKFKQITLSRDNLYAIDEKGKLYGCGANRYSQLGGTDENDVTTIKVIDDTKIYKQVETGTYGFGMGFVIVVDIDNTVWTMGDNYIDGDRTAPNNTSFTYVKDNVKKVQALDQSFYLLTNDGEIWSTGESMYGQLGIGVGEEYIYELTKVDSSRIYTDIIAIKDSLLAIDSEGQYWACGKNSYGSLLTGTTGDEANLTNCKLLNNKKNIKCAYVMDDNAFYIDNDGKIHTFGYNNGGLLGNGESYYVERRILERFTKVYGYNGNYVKIAAGERTSMALDLNGNVYTWGYNADGECGNGTFAGTINEPTVIQNIKVKDVSDGCSFSAVIDTDGNLFTFGSNGSGRLGVGKLQSELKNSYQLLQVKEGTKFSKVSCGQSNMYALDEEGNLWAWGENTSGELGDGTKTNRSLPVQIAAGTKFKEIVAGSDRSFALDMNGHLWSTGNNKYGILATGNNISTNILTQVSDTRVYTKISGFYDTLVAIDDEGNAYTCGYNNHGELGDGTNNNKNILTQVMVGTKFVSCASAWNNTYLVDIKGNLWGTGVNWYGELGRNWDEPEETSVFLKISADEKIVDVVSSGGYLLALTESGTVYACGDNEYMHCTRFETTDDDFSIVKIKK